MIANKKKVGLLPLLFSFPAGDLKNPKKGDK
jgi:hypothetical protein